MTKRFKVRASARCVSEALLAISLAALAGTAFAVPGYVTGGGGDFAVVNSAGQCWKTGDWTPDKARDPCDPVPRAATPAPAPVAEAPKPPEPVAAAPLAAPAPVIEKVNLATDVLFPFDSATLLPGGKKKLDEIAETSQGAEVDRVVIVGHTDRIGSDDYNQQLSERRALAVKEYLAQKGAPEDRVEAEGRGKTDPVTGDQCERMGPARKSNSKLVACLQPDRRVEIEILGSRESSATGAPSSTESTSGTGR